MSSYKRTYRATPGARNEPSGRVNKYPGMYVGIVKDNADVQTMGRLKVWVPEFGSEQSDEQGWRTVGYCSPFAGSTPITSVGNDLDDYDQSQTSYGMWFVPPDLETQVVIFFAGGDPGRGFWFGCLYGQNMNHMVPGVAASENYRHPDSSFPTGKTVPVGEYNKRTNEKVTNNIKRPVAKPFHEGVASQGLINDRVRGTTTSSARRESPSQVYGISTPGPKTIPQDPNTANIANDPKLDQRKGGHSFVMDDGAGTEHITFKTRSGSQIRIDETNGLMYFINKNGTAWIQLDNDGNVDIFSAKDISLRAMQDFNIRADRNINIEAGQNIYMKASKDTDANLNIVGEDAGIGGDIFIQAVNDEHHTVKQNMFVTVTDGNLDIDIQTGNKTENVATDVNINVGSNKTETVVGSTGVKSANYQIDATGNIDTEGKVISSGIMYAPNFKTPSHGLNEHQHYYVAPEHAAGNASTTTLGGGEGTSSTTGPDAALAIPAATKQPAPKTNVLVDFADDYKFVRNTQGVKTIVDRFVTYEPCPEHKNKGGQSEDSE